jgi:hypothetical protein
MRTAKIWTLSSSHQKGSFESQVEGRLLLLERYQKGRETIFLAGGIERP